jgi:hypothetical protein
MWPTEPQRHREGTEKAQSHPLTSQTRRHEGTKTSQRPPTQNSTTWRGPGRRRTTAGDRWTGLPLRSRAIVAVAPPSGPRSNERRPRHSSSSFQSREGHAFEIMGEDARRNRRAPSAAAGGEHGGDGRPRPEPTCFPPVGGGRQIADRPAVNPRHLRITPATTPSCLRAFVFAMSSSVLLLCVSVSLWFAGGRFLGIA